MLDNVVALSKVALEEDADDDGVNDGKYVDLTVVGGVSNVLSSLE